MPLESATFITDLVETNPIHTDGLDNADAHLRLIKGVLQASFPNINGAVTATPAELNASGLAFAVPGVFEVANNGSTGAELILDGPTGSGDVLFLNSGVASSPGALEILVEDATGANPQVAASLTRAGVMAALLAFDAPSIRESGNPLIPAGMIMLWSGSVASIPAGWLLCNGSNGTPDLRGAFVAGAGGGLAVAQTGGASSATITSSSDGTHSHTGATGAAGGATPTGTTDVQGAHSHTGVTADHTLTTTEMPSHTHLIQDGLHLGGAGGFQAACSDNSGAPGITDSTGGGGPHSHGISSDGSHAHNLTMNALPAHTHSISSDGAHTHTVTANSIPPFYALCYVMKS